jgi:hypothetical protein
VAQPSNDSTKRCNQLHTAHDLRRNFPLKACSSALSLIGATPNHSCQVTVHALKFVYSLDSLTLAAFQKLSLCADTIGNIEVLGYTDHRDTICLVYMYIYLLVSGCASIDEDRDQEASRAVESQYTNLSATAKVLGQKPPWDNGMV